MTTTFILLSILEVTAAVLVIVGFVFEEKVIAFEERCEDRIARKIANFLCKSKLTKNIVKRSPETVQQRAETNYVCAQSTTDTPTTRKRTGRVA